MSAGPLVPDPIVYPGAPLRAVAIEVRFRPLLDARTRFAAFQRRHATEFTRLYEITSDELERERLPEGREFSQLNSAVLMTRSRERAVSVANDMVGVITYPYSEGFAGFASWAVPMLREALADVGVEQILGVNYRYENRIPQDTKEVDLGRLFNLSLAAPREADQSTYHVHLYWHQKWAEGLVAVDLEACPHVSAEEIHLNITSYCAAKAQLLDNIEETIHTAHRLARTTFENLITPGFREHLKSGKN